MNNCDVKYNVKICLLLFRSFYFRSSSNFRVVFLIGSPSFSPPRWSSVLLHVHYTTVHISLPLLLPYIYTYAFCCSNTETSCCTLRRSPYISAYNYTDLHSTLHSSLCSFTNDEMALELQSKQQSNPYPENAGWTHLFPPKIPLFSLAPNQELFFNFQHFCSSMSRHFWHLTL